MNLRVRTDKQGLLRGIPTDAAKGDISPLPELIHGSERDLQGDGAFWRENDR